MKILVDMNLSPAWVRVLRSGGHLATHWSAIGDPRAPDRVVLGWARANRYVLFTHDLDFGAILAASGARTPSVVRLRAQDVTPARGAMIVLNVLRLLGPQLAAGALVSVDEERFRVRLLPLPPARGSGS